MDYIRSLSKPSGEGCFLCEAAAASEQGERDADLLILWRSPRSIILMNRYPYTNGHLLVAPRAHHADLEDLNPDEILDMQTQTIEAVKLLKKAVAAQGFNIGINLGRPAGAGLPGHLHQHIVPRWNGDTNFMHVIGETHIVPQAMSQMYEELKRLRLGTPTS